MDRREVVEALVALVEAVGEEGDVARAYRDLAIELGYDPELSARMDLVLRDLRVVLTEPPPNHASNTVYTGPVREQPVDLTRPTTEVCPECVDE